MCSSEKGIDRQPLRERALRRSKARFFSDVILLFDKGLLLALDIRFSCRFRIQPEREVWIVVDRIAAFLSCRSIASSKIFGIAANATFDEDVFIPSPSGIIEDSARLERVFLTSLSDPSEDCSNMLGGALAPILSVTTEDLRAL